MDKLERRRPHVTRSILATGAGALLSLVFNVHAEGFQALGQKVEFTNPAGYCDLGDSEAERAYVAFARAAVGPNIRIIKYLARCDELNEFKSGKREAFSHFIQIQLVGPKGVFRTYPMGREAFLTALSGVDVSHSLEKADLNRMLHSRVDTQINITKPEYASLGRDQMAVYYSLRIVVDDNGRAMPISGISGVTLVNSLPLSFIVYDGSNDAQSRKTMLPTLMGMLKDVEEANQAGAGIRGER